MPKRGIDYCLDVMDYLRQKGYKSECPVSVIRMAIGIKAGSLEQTRKRYFSLLQEFSFIEMKGNGIAILNFEKAAELGI